MIQIGYVDLTLLDEGVYQRLYDRAGPHRRQRADRYLRREDALRCIAADALLRYVLRRTLGTDRVETAVTAEGKPFLRDRKDFHFNLSHSGHWVVIAWGCHPVGIDVEMIRMDESKLQLARRFFASDEQDWLFAAPEQERSLRFFEIWTRKESYLKYLGTGINRSLNSFSVLNPRALEVTFRSEPLEDAMLTLCSQGCECKIIPVTGQMLLTD